MNVCQKQPQSTRAFADHPFIFMTMAEGGVRWNNYVLVIDYYSHYIEVASLTTTMIAVIERLKAIFAHHGVPEVMVTDKWAKVCGI